MIKISELKSCMETPPTADGDYLVVRFEADGQLAYASIIHYTTKWGWNTYLEFTKKPSTFFNENNEYDRACLWTTMTKEEEGT